MRLCFLLFLVFTASSLAASTPKFLIKGNNSQSVLINGNTLSFIFHEKDQRFRIDVELPGFSVAENNKIEGVFYSGYNTYSIVPEISLVSGQSVIQLGKLQDRFILDMSHSDIPRLDIQGAEAVLYNSSFSAFISNGTLLPLEIKVRGNEADKLIQLADALPIPVIDGTTASGNWSTFEGGSSDDNIISIDRSPSSIVVCGSTLSTDFPVTPGAHSDSIAGYYDVFVSSYSLNGNKNWSTYFGGNNLDLPAKVLSDSLGTIYFSGYTSSSNFPVIGNPVQDSLKGGYDVFMVKLDASGQPVYSGFFGGSAADFGYAMSRDGNGNIIIGGGTTSSDLPTTSGAAQQNFAGAVDAFVVKLDPAFQVTWCTYFGGGGSEDMHAMCSDDSSNVIFSGGTFSPDFPTVNGFQMTSNGAMETYIVKLNDDGGLQWSTYFGGTANDDSYGVAADLQGNIFITGHTQSQGLPFSGSFQDTLKGSYDAYVLKLSPSGSFMEGTYMGGTSSESNVVCDLKNGLLFLAGTTMSPDLTTDTLAFQQVNSGSSDAFYALFDTSLQYLHSGYFGGTSAETVTSVEADTGRSFFIGGKTSSTSLPFVFAGEQPVKSGGEDGFLALLDPASGLVNTDSFNKSRLDLVYPVPFIDELFIETDIDTGLVMLFDASGRLILGQEIQKRILLNTSDISPGIYLLTFQTSLGPVSRKVVKL